MLKSHLAKKQDAYTGDTAEAGCGGGALERDGPLRRRGSPLQPGNQVGTDLFQGAVDDRLKRTVKSLY
jgi:hypothetical protein